jgi:hypothetical protein
MQRMAVCLTASISYFKVNKFTDGSTQFTLRSCPRLQSNGTYAPVDHFLRVFVAVLKTIAVAGLNLLKLRRTKITPT